MQVHKKSDSAAAAETADAPSEASLRLDVAMSTRLLNSLKILEYSGHVSARLPGGVTFLIQPQEKSRAEVSPDDLLVCDLDGKVVSGPEGVKPPSEVFLHCEIFRARMDVNSIAHFHHDVTNVFTLVEDVPLLPFKNHAVRWKSGIPVHPDPAHVDDAEKGRGIVATLGPHHAMQIRAHGQIVTAETVRGVFIDSLHLVENAEAAYRAAAIGKLKPLTEAEIESFSHGFRRGHHIRKLWNYYARGAIRDGIFPEAWNA
ncbi:class II aldolase/adducin family protein [Sinorhizobium sp. 7-81]|uniref:class II aldolase/adducin family protein n=1 Tax=Sinorhizobium sp. 8-89 TaxID=3049089 RepID=UPI0024C21DAC|nr:class II aldolase/adducin family protein [Sinorhizobium sp. 8-89]MDK1492598.1 class II aldolase/adducin family protein [Sinorhizobium sp. 8-89]